MYMAFDVKIITFSPHYTNLNSGIYFVKYSELITLTAFYDNHFADNRESYHNYAHPILQNKRHHL